MPNHDNTLPTPDTQRTESNVGNQVDNKLRPVHVQVTITGAIVGRIWMPAATCGKRFQLSRDRFNFPTTTPSAERETLREMVLRATNDGDFQNCSIIDATVTFTRTFWSRGGATMTCRKRHMDIRSFPTVADCVVELDSAEYFEGLDSFKGGE